MRWDGNPFPIPFRQMGGNGEENSSGRGLLLRNIKTRGKGNLPEPEGALLAFFPGMPEVEQLITLSRRKIRL